MRVQRSRSKGWRAPADAIYVGRPTKWGNPHGWQDFDVKAKDLPWDVNRDAFRRELAVGAFREDLLGGRLPFTTDDVRRELRGHILMCWCSPLHRCHADVLLEIAND